MENEYITADQLNTVFKRDSKNKKNKHCAQDFDSNHVHQTFLSLRDIFKSSGSACAHTTYLTCFLLDCTTGGQSGNARTCSRFIEMPANLSGSVLFEIKRAKPSREEQRYHRLNQTTGVLVRLHLSRCSLKRDGSQLRFEFL